MKICARSAAGACDRVSVSKIAVLTSRRLFSAMLRLHLPPNLVAAAGRDAVPLRVELDMSDPPPLELFPVLALLQRWCGPGAPPKFIQLTRSQLRELAAAAGTHPIFVENGHATSWQHRDLVENKP